MLCALSFHWYEPAFVRLQSWRWVISKLVFPVSGNYDGLGQTRAAEMTSSARVLGFKQLFQVDDAQLQDGPKNPWPADVVANYVINHAVQHQIDSVRSTRQYTFFCAIFKQ